MRAVALCLRAFLLGWLVVFVSDSQLFAQFGNEWISGGRPYVKIQVARQALYRVSAEALFSAGIPMGTDPDQLQVFHRGVEHAILVNAGADGSFDAGDFIEFYGEPNDGRSDTELYNPASHQPHIHYNLYSDTTAYFLTVAESPGKRVQPFVQAPGSLPVLPFHVDEKLLVNTQQYATGRDESEVQLTGFDLGEGWTGNQILQTQAIDYSVASLSGQYPAGGVPTVELLLQGRGPMAHQADIFLGAGQRLAGTVSFAGFESYKATVNAEWSDIAADGTLAVRVRCNGVAGGSDRISVSYIKVRYPQTTDMSNALHKTFELPDQGPVTRVQIANAPAGIRLFDVTDPASLISIDFTGTTTIEAVVATGRATRLFATSEVIVPPVTPVRFNPIAPGDYDYLIISNPLLRTPALGYADPVAAYAAYRQSVEGGAFKPLVVNIGELCDAFNYGEYSPLAIYRFLRFMTSGGSPRYLLLAGKGLEVFHNWHRNQGSSAFAVYKDFVPSAGYPSSDMVYSVGLSGTTYEPAIPTGRIPAIRAADIAAYLNKVKEMEAQPYDALWRKDVMHLSGGIYEGEPQLFKAYMEDFAESAEGPFLGGRVSALAKHSREVQLINIADQVNNGLNLITFFGHASPTLLDFQLGFVTDPVQGYHNKGRYPTMLMNGCQVGDFNQNTTLFGEDWVVAPDRGALAFIGHSGYGFIGLLKKYTQLFYDVGYADGQYVKQGLGDIQKEVARRFMEGDGGSITSVTQAQQMMLLGDPAVKLFGASKADLEISDNDVSITSFDGQPINTQTDSFAVRVIVRNYGLAPGATVRLEVRQTLADQSTLSYDSLFPVTRYSDTLMIVIRKDARRDPVAGDNRFRVTIDPDDLIEEYSKSNNVAEKTLAIVSNGTRNLFPADFAIINTAATNLVWQTYELVGAEREFLVELDTVPNFSSPFRKQWQVAGAVLGRQPAELAPGDTVVHYWRTKLATPLPGERAAWEYSSFTYIPNGTSGWAQLRFPQFMENNTVGLLKDTTLREIRFLETTQPLAVRALGSQHPHHYDSTSIRIGGAEYFTAFPGFGCRANTINLVAFDRRSATPYLGVKLEWFNRFGRTCGREPMVMNSYTYQDMVGDGVTDIVGYVNNISKGDSVVLFSIGNAWYSLWPETAKSKLGELGISAAQLTLLQDGEPVVIFGRKGDPPGSAIVARSSDPEPSLQSVSVSRTITGAYSNGTMRSDWIGPAVAWSEFHPSAVRQELTDTVSFSVRGVTVEGEEELLFSGITASRDLTGIDADIYPYIRISVEVSDDTYITSPQLRQWLVTYTPGPEGLLIYQGTAGQDEVAEGGAWQTAFGFVNIGGQSFADSVTVRYEMFNQQTLATRSSSVKVRAPLPGDTTRIPVTLDTRGMGGVNDFQVYANPRVLPEHYYDNNLLLLRDKISVVEDDLDPVLDVTIDGRRIKDGDFVSPEPTIKIRLWDENTVMLKTDTAGVRIFLTYPCGATPCPAQQILLSDARVQWYPATANSDFTVEFRPETLDDGAYMLRVEGADAKGNGADLAPYEINFVVKQETTITLSDAFPNPSRDDVQFDVVVSGQRPPDHLELTIVGLNGQLQEVLTGSDFPPLHLGRNELTWRGSTRSGQLLPEGLYIYRLSIGVSGRIVQRSGKLALIRR